jgi:uncharacterized UBP type Zn finger protein
LFYSFQVRKAKSNIPVIDAAGLQQLTDGLFSSYEQHDSHEFLLHILAEMQEECHTKSKMPEFKVADEAISHYFSTHTNVID